MTETKKLLKIVTILAITGADAFAAAKRSDRRIIVSIPDRKLVLLEGPRVLKIYDIAVGAASTPSPSGDFQIVSRIQNPTWFGHGKMIGPGRANPLGNRWLGLSIKGYGIHGTNAPDSIGKAASHGCIRMRKHDIEELFDLVDVGVSVELASERPAGFLVLLAVAVTE
jgi:lipoprotein-anchoring transpeptidase ErfK/SrfK